MEFYLEESLPIDSGRIRLNIFEKQIDRSLQHGNQIGFKASYGTISIDKIKLHPGTLKSAEPTTKKKEDLPPISNNKPN